MNYQEKAPSIKHWNEDDRPREKLILKGKSVLSDAELIAILLGSGNKQESAVDLAKRILASVNNNINKLAKLNVENLCMFKGIGHAKAISIITALELGKRRLSQEALILPIIKSSTDVYQVMQPILSDLQHEEFWILYMDNSNKIIKKTALSKGGITVTTVDVRLIFKMAVECFAVGIILCHNHPSDKLFPSNADIKITEKIKKAGLVLDIQVLDHIIITATGYYSFADKGKL